MWDNSHDCVIQPTTHATCTHTHTHIPSNWLCLAQILTQICEMIVKFSGYNYIDIINISCELIIYLILLEILTITCWVI